MYDYHRIIYINVYRRPASKTNISNFIRRYQNRIACKTPDGWTVDCVLAVQLRNSEHPANDTHKMWPRRNMSTGNHQMVMTSFRSQDACMRHASHPLAHLSHYFHAEMPTNCNTLCHERNGVDDKANHCILTIHVWLDGYRVS